ncbi:MAG: F0F1 ATP synthase subunit B [Dehalococcoidia bacterium]
MSSRRLTAALVGIVAAALPAGAAAAEEASGIAALGFNLPGLISQLVNFLILLIVLRIFLYRPLLKMIDQRKQRIEEGLNRAEQAAEQASVSEDEARRVMDEARAEGRAAVQRSQEAAERLREELEQRARDDAEQIVARAREDVRVERDRAIQQLHEAFADLTIAASERVIGQSLDRSAHQRLIDEVLAGSSFDDGDNGAGAQPGQGDQG